MKETIVRGRRIFCQIAWTAMILSLGRVQAIPAADAQTAKKRFPLEAAFINHAVSPVFDGTILDILHPGFSLETELLCKELKK